MLKFVQVVEDPSYLIPVVEERLPISSAVFNQLKFYDKYKADLEIWTYGENKPEGLWVITVFHREDWGVWMGVSAPEEEQFDGDMVEDVRQSLLSGKIFSWEEKFFFIAVPPQVTRLVLKLIMEETGHIVSMYPCYLFRMEPEEALQMEINPPSGVELKRLEPEAGTSFITDNWHYTREGTATMVKKSIERLPSGGVFLNGAGYGEHNDNDCICGAITTGYGHISMLHTDPEHRRKGHASLIMRFILKEMAKEGLQPCLFAERPNKGAVNLYQGMGLSSVKVASVGIN